jgi:DNA-binding response OmpR family regulator
LLIEDEEAHVELIRRAFVESPEWLIHHAATFNEAIQWLAENETTPPSLILADYLLPDGKGIDIIEKAKKLGDAGAGVPVIILTAYGSEVVTSRGPRSESYAIGRTSSGEKKRKKRYGNPKKNGVILSIL